MIDRAQRLIHHTIALSAAVHVLLREPRQVGSRRLPRDQRGLSQSTEYVILLAGAVAVAGLVIVLVRNYINAHPIPEP